MTKKHLMIATGAAALLAASPAFAGTATVIINSQLSVIDGCVINGSPGGASVILNFGTIQNAGAITGPIDAQTGAGAITLLCNVSSLTAAISVGPGANGSTAQPTLRNPAAAGTAAEFVPYDIYAAAGRTPASKYVPDGTSIAFNGGVITANVPSSIDFFGRIPTATNAVSGSYADPRTATVSF